MINPKLEFEQLWLGIAATWLTALEMFCLFYLRGVWWWNTFDLLVCWSLIFSSFTLQSFGLLLDHWSFALWIFNLFVFYSLIFWSTWAETATTKRRGRNLVRKIISLLKVYINWRWVSFSISLIYLFFIPYIYICIPDTAISRKMKDVKSGKSNLTHCSNFVGAFCTKSGLGLRLCLMTGKVRKSHFPHFHPNSSHIVPNQVQVCFVQRVVWDWEFVWRSWTWGIESPPKEATTAAFLAGNIHKQQ